MFLRKSNFSNFLSPSLHLLGTRICPAAENNRSTWKRTVIKQKSLFLQPEINEAW
jgi:hypothetical protein